MDDLLLDMQGLTLAIGAGRSSIHALNGVDIALRPGDALGLLGESGSGKSLTLRAIMRLLPPGSRVGGRLAWRGQDVLAMPRRTLRRLRGGEIAMVFQEPMTAMDQTFSVGHQIVEAIRSHDRCSHGEARRRAIDLLEMVQIPSAARRFHAYPQEMSGGMRQRAMIALALSCRPRLLLADEPTTALDVTVQIQILLLLRQLQRDLGMALIFVTHDIAAATEVADTLAIMYGGRIVERGSLAEVIRTPAHPYTRGLIGAVASRRPGERFAGIPGRPPRLEAPPAACAFHPRCALARDLCRQAVPPMTGAGHAVACFHTGAQAVSGEAAQTPAI